jgi:spermidine/putrescine transport system permease protein
MAKQRAFDVTTLPGFTFIAILSFVLLYAPIATLVIYSFNGGNSVNQWGGFSLQWYVVAFNNEAVQDAAARSLIIAVWASVISTVLATMAALGTTRRGKFKGQTVIYIILNQPLMVPEIVTAVALLIFFSSVKVVTGYTGLGYLILAHSAFCILKVWTPRWRQPPRIYTQRRGRRFGMSRCPCCCPV